MPFPILAGKAIVDTGYEVANSCRFNKADAPELSRSTGDGNERIGNFSFWWKTAMPHDGFRFYNVYIDANNFFAIGMDGGGNIEVVNKSGGSYNMALETTAAYRDHTAWYHVCALIDTTQSTEANRVKLYINGTQVTSFQTETYPDQNQDLHMNANSETATISHSGNRVHGYLAEFVAIDGTVKVIGDFGEFDEDSPTIWKPKDVSDLSGDKGTNGFYLDFEDSSALGNCAFGGTDFTVSNLAAADQATDSPTNNFAVLNPLDNVIAGTDIVYTEGNCNMVAVVDTLGMSQSTLAASSGKWYAEFKVTAVGDNLSGGRTSVGVGSRNNAQISGGGYYGNTSSPIDSYGKVSWAASYASNDGGTTSYGSTFVDDDIIGVYLDLDNNKLYFSENGTLYSTTGIDITAAASTQNGHYHIGVSDASSNDNTSCAANYGGCPGFAISSSNSDDNGYGSFEYSPNITGDGSAKSFYALCTKNLAEFG